MKNGDEDDSDHDSFFSDNTDDASYLGCPRSPYIDKDYCRAFSDDGDQSNKLYEDLKREYNDAIGLCEFRKNELLKAGIMIFDTQTHAFKYVDKYDCRPLSVFASDVPMKPKPGSVKLGIAKFYMVGSPQRFFGAFSTMRHIVADEVIRMKPGYPVPLYFDVEIKNGGDRNWNLPEDIDPFYLRSQRDAIRNLINGLRLNCDDENVVNTLAEQYCLLSHGVWTADECAVGLRILTCYITSRLVLMLRGSPPIDGLSVEEACKQMHVTSSCREKKLSFHIVMDRIMCEHQSLSMPLVVHDLKGWFMKNNLQWLIDNYGCLDTLQGKFRIRALMVNELMLGERVDGVFDGRGGTPFDQAVYSPNHLMRCVMSSKFCKSGEPKLPMVPLHPSVYGMKHRGVTRIGVNQIMTDSVTASFDQVFKPYDDIDEWRKYTVTCRAFVDSPRRCYVIARLKPDHWDYYPSKRTWWNHHRKYSRDFDGMCYNCEVVGATVTSLYRGDAARHYSETRKMKETVACTSSDDLDNLDYGGDSEKCHPLDKVRTESGKKCYLYQINLGDRFFCGRGKANEKTASANLLHSDYGIIYCCFCKHCAGKTYRSVPKEDLLDIFERRYPYKDEETLTSNDPNAKFRKFDAKQHHANVDLEIGRKALFDDWEGQDRLDKYDWKTVVEDALKQPDGSGPKFYIIDAPCETGKTYEMQQLCKATQECGGRYMFVVHRRSLADLLYSQNRDTGCVHYTRFPRDMFWDNTDDHGQLKFHFVSVYNSLNRFGYGGKPDVLILDEFALLRRHIINKTTQKCIARAHERFVSLVKEAKLVIMLQHVVSLEDARFITSLADVDPQDRRKVLPLLVKKPTVMHPLKITKRHAVAVTMMLEKYADSFVSRSESDDDESDQDEDRRYVGRDTSSTVSSDVSSLTWSQRGTGVVIKDRAHQSGTCDNGQAIVGSGESSGLDEPRWGDDNDVSFRTCHQPFVVFCTKKSDSMYFANLLKKEAFDIGADPARIRLVNASLKEVDEWNQAFFNNPNGRACDCDVLIATSVIGSGISLDTHFGSFVAFLYSGILTVSDDWQLIRRCRVGASLKANVDRTSILYIEEGGGGSGSIDIVAAMGEGEKLHADIVSEVARKYKRNNKVLDKIAEVNSLKQSLHFNELNRAYWTNKAENLQSRSKHNELWTKYLKDTLSPGSWTDVDETHGYSEELLAKRDKSLREWNKTQAKRIARKLGRGGEKCRLVAAEGVDDEDFEAMLERLDDDDVLKRALLQQSQECSLNWENAFPGGLDYVAEVIAMKLFASVGSSATAKITESLRQKFALHMSSTRWRNRYIRNAVGLCIWISSFYSPSEDFYGFGGVEALYDTSSLYAHIGGAAFNRLVKTRVCKSLLPLLFTANPKELPYIITPAESPFYIGLTMAPHTSLCEFFRWALDIPDEPGGTSKCPIDTTAETRYGTALSKTHRAQLRTSIEHILSHHDQTHKKVTLAELVSNPKEAHKFIQYLGKHIGLDFQTDGTFHREGGRLTKYTNKICIHDLALALATKPQIRAQFLVQLPTMKARHNLPAEGVELVKGALSLCETVNASLGKASGVHGWDSLMRGGYFTTVPQRVVETSKCRSAREAADEVLLGVDRSPRHDVGQSEMEAIVERAFARAEDRDNKLRHGVEPGLFHIPGFVNDDDEDDAAHETHGMTRHEPNMFVDDEASDVDDEGGYSSCENDDVDVSKRKRIDGSTTVTTCPASSLSGSYPISDSSMTSPSRSPMKKKQAYGSPWPESNSSYSETGETFESSQMDYSPQKKQTGLVCMDEERKIERCNLNRHHPNDDDSDEGTSANASLSKVLFPPGSDGDGSRNDNGCEDMICTDEERDCTPKTSRKSHDYIGSEYGDEKKVNTVSRESVSPCASSSTHGMPNGLVNQGVTCFANVIYQCLATDICFFAISKAAKEHRLRCDQCNPGGEGHHCENRDEGGTEQSQVDSALPAKQRVESDTDRGAKYFPLFRKGAASKRRQSLNEKSQCALCMFLKLANEIRRGDRQTITPCPVTQAIISSREGGLSSSREQDPHEFFDLVIKRMEGCIAEPGVEPSDQTTSDNTPNSISQIFQGEECKVTQCRGCGHKNTRKDLMGVLTLSVPNLIGRETLSIERLLKHYHAEETPPDYKCDKCKENGTSILTSTMSAPPILTILLNLTKYDGVSRSKNMTQIELCRTLQVGNNDESVGNNDVCYRLFAVVVHQGKGSESGHYIAFVNNSGQWWKCDDNTITSVMEDDVLGVPDGTNRPYMLFYVRDKWNGGSNRGNDDDEVEILSSSRAFNHDNDDEEIYEIPKRALVQLEGGAIHDMYGNDERKWEHMLMTKLADLTPDDNGRVQEALCGNGKPNDILVSHEQDSVQRSSMNRLLPNTWLNDEVVNYFLKVCLAARDAHICETETGRKRSHFFNSFFVQQLFDEKNISPNLRGRYKYKNVANWGKKVPGGDIFNLKYIFIPRNVDNMHWTSACIFVELKMIVYFDSYRNNDPDLMHGLLQYLMDEWKNTRMNQVMDWDEWKLVACPVDTPSQTNSVDCGAFTCMYADFITNDCKSIFHARNMGHFRRYIALSILNGIATRGTEDYSRGEDG